MLCSSKSVIQVGRERERVGKSELEIVLTTNLRDPVNQKSRPGGVKLFIQFVVGLLSLPSSHVL